MNADRDTLNEMWKAGLLLGLSACDIAFGFQSIPFRADASEPLAQGMVAHYTLDGLEGNVASEEVDQHDARCVAEHCPTPTAGIIGGALSFDPSTQPQYLAIQPSSALALVPAYTVTAWIELTQPPTGPDDACPINQTYGGGSGKWNAWQFCISPEALPTFYSITPDFCLEIAQHPVALPIGHWTHVAFENDGAMMTLWLDGILVASTAAAAPMADVDGITLLGADLDAGSVSGAFAGALDDVRLYARAVDRDELAQLAAETP